MEKIDYFSLSELKEVIGQKEELVNKEARLSNPLLTDINFVSYIYQWYQEIQEMNHWRSRIGARRFRKQFLFIILYLFSPAALAGGKMGVGLRDELARLFGIKAATSISNACSDLLFQYKSYKDFRREVNIVYNQLIEKLKKEKII